MDTKVCCKCKEVKLLEEFYKDKSRKDSHQTKCKVCVKKFNTDYRVDNPDYQFEYYAANPEKLKEYQVEYRAANPEKNKAWVSNYRAVKLEAIPPWLTKEDYKAMEAIGKEADRLTKETGIKHEVDHIIPLQPPKVVMFEGKMIPLICAFQCPANLQILTKSQNCSKGNRFTPYVESELTD